METRLFSKTPSGEPCLVLGNDGIAAKILEKTAHGKWQQNVVQDLFRNGYVVESRLTENKGYLVEYQSARYTRNLGKVMSRVRVALAEKGYYLESGKVGPKGGFGYYVTELSV